MSSLNALMSMLPYVYIVQGYNKERNKILVSGYQQSNTTPLEIDPPYMAGAGGTGLFSYPPVGSKVLCIRSPFSNNQTYCIGIIPNEVFQALQSNPFSTEASKPFPDFPVGASLYPDLDSSSDICLQSDHGSGVYMYENFFKIKDKNNSGMQIFTGSIDESSLALFSSNFVNISESSISYSGTLKRFRNGGQNRLPGERTDNDFDFDRTYFDRTNAVGLFTKYSVKPIYKNGLARNPSRVENKKVFNEFSSDFKGFDIEQLSFDDENNGSRIQHVSDFNRTRISKSKELDSVLNLAPHSLYEVISGNLFDVYGSELDINYQPIIYGGPPKNIKGSFNKKQSTSGYPPLKDSENKFIESKLVSRRGVGYHFNYSTKVDSTDIDNSTENFVLKVDKEGCLKINVPKNSDTGNILIPDNSSFYSETQSITAKQNYKGSLSEQTPITLWKSNGEYYPKLSAKERLNKGVRGIGVLHNGIRSFVSNDSNDPSDSSDSISKIKRINPTAHHNMYAAAEMLIANRIVKINIPDVWTNKDGLVEGTSNFENFEIPLEEKKSSFNPDNIDIPRNYATSVYVHPSEPAIRTGGGVAVAGLSSSNASDGGKKALSNSFTVKNKSPEFDEQTIRTGGKSINANLEGSAEISIGKDNSDSKSLILDMAGSMVAWFGKDNNNRSIVAQTDGEVLFNIGGSRGGEDGKEFNKGRFDLRVNVTDKGFAGVEKTNEKFYNSDYVISISENGIVIAGMQEGKPMLIKNSGNICVESDSVLTLSGAKVMVKEAGAKPRSVSKDARGLSS